MPPHPSPPGTSAVRRGPGVCEERPPCHRDAAHQIPTTSVPGNADRDFPVVDEILQRGGVSDRPAEAAQHQVQAGGRRRLD